MPRVRPRRAVDIRRAVGLFAEAAPSLPVVTTKTFLSASRPLLVPAYGAGRDSTALLIELHRRGIVPDLILFADTGSERPETNRYLPVINEWLGGVGFPQVTVVKKASPKVGDTSLEAECLRKGMLPSISYGGHSCSAKWKAQPQEKFLNNWMPARVSWKRRERLVRAIGYEADECGRIARAQTYQSQRPSKKFLYWHPLHEWGMTLSDCIDTIKAAGLPVPVKSSCYFCGAAKKDEIEQLAALHPDLFLRALMLEQKAAPSNKSVKGLGRNFAWRDLPSAAPFLVQISRQTTQLAA